MSHAEGNGAQASGTFSHAEGQSSQGAHEGNNSSNSYAHEGTDSCIW